MNFKNRLIIFTVFTILLFFNICFILVSINNSVVIADEIDNVSNSDNSEPVKFLTVDEMTDLQARVEKSNCPMVIKDYIRKLSSESSRASIALVGKKIVKNGQTEYGIDLSCLGPNIIESSVIRVTSFLYMIIGAVLSFGLGKSTLLIATSSDNAEQKQKGWQGITNSIIYMLVGIFSYFIIIFIIVGVLGLGNNGQPEQNILCQQQIVFDITFDDGIGACQ